MYGFSQQKGHRDYMEDKILIYKNKETRSYIAAVFDGHGGSECSNFLKKNFLKLLSFEFPNGLSNKNIKNRLLKLSNKINKIILDRKISAGSTANILIIIKNRYHILNTGDSRIYACMKNKSVKQISKDHKLNNQEVKNIYQRGGFIKDGRVNGILALARAYGDYGIHTSITHKPDYYTGLIKDVSFFVQGSDGIFDVITNYELQKRINKLYNKKVGLNDISKKLITHIINDKQSQDNCSLIITRV